MTTGDSGRARLGRSRQAAMRCPSSLRSYKASVVTGPYTDVTGAVSGYMYDVTTGPKLFFRLRQM